MFALQCYVGDHSQPGDDVRFSIEKGFYVDNLLQCLPTRKTARQMVDELRDLLASGGFELCQWASNVPSVIKHLPKDAQSDSPEFWLAQDRADLRMVNSQGRVHLSFLLARSRVAPKQLLSMPRLELCGAVTGAQPAKLLEKELTLKMNKTILWTDD